jgi:pyruvate dehydrogenase E2 component (dihydrolipoamide acetyltransferase)
VSAWTKTDVGGTACSRARCRNCGGARTQWLVRRCPRAQIEEQLHLGIAVDIADGLIVPVLRDLAPVRTAARRAIASSKAHGDERQGDLMGATMTLTNFGMIAGLHATPVVMPPHRHSRRRSNRRPSNSGGDGRASLISCRSARFRHRCVAGGGLALPAGGNCQSRGARLREGIGKWRQTR